MNREREIVNFLEEIQSFAVTNNHVLDEHKIYSALIRYGLQPNEKNVGVIALFSPWMEKFKNNPNIDVFESDKQKHFLQFQNNIADDSKYFKLYVSLAPNAIYEGVYKIFDFISKNNMSHASKVADQARSDLVVIRLASTEDAEKVINFINNDEFLKENARTTNPFLNREGNVGIGYDDFLSYNTVLAHFIADYLNTKIPTYADYLDYVQSSNRNKFNVAELLNIIKKTTPEDYENFMNNKNSESYKKFIDSTMRNKKITYEDFVQFLNERYINLFRNQIELNGLIQTPLFQTSLNRIRQDYSYINNPELYVINNYRIVFECILNNVYMDSYKNMYSKMEESRDIFNKMTNIDKTQLLNNFIVFAYLKYGQNLDIVVEALTRYSNSDVNAITRDNDFRNQFIYNINPNQINVLTNNNIYGYVSSLLEYRKTEIIEASIPYNDDEFDIFLGGLRATFEKHGLNQVKLGVEELLKGNFTVMSNGDFKYRDFFINKYSVDELKVIAMRYVNKLVGSQTVELTSSYGELVAQVLVNEYGFDSPGMGAR